MRPQASWKSGAACIAGGKPPWPSLVVRTIRCGVADLLSGPMRCYRCVSRRMNPIAKRGPEAASRMGGAQRVNHGSWTRGTAPVIESSDLGLPSQHKVQNHPMQTHRVMPHRHALSVRFMLPPRRDAALMERCAQKSPRDWRAFRGITSCRSRGARPRTSSSGSRADRTPVPHPPRRWSGSSPACCARRRPGSRPSRSPARSTSS